MENYIKVLKYLVDNPTLDWIGSSSEVCVETFKELYDKGFVEGIDSRGDTSESFEFLEPKITFNGRQFLASFKLKS